VSDNVAGGGLFLRRFPLSLWLGREERARPEGLQWASEKR
jgi:hypothetical protein